MIHQSKSYLKFLRKSKNQHGVHSPFVYDLVTKCFYDRQQKTSYEIIKLFRKSIKKNRSKITVTDLGAGSRVFKTPVRAISKIGKHAGTKLKRAKLLNRLITYLNIETALELGTSVGMATVALAAGNPSTKLTTIEGCKETSNTAKKLFEKFQLENVNVINDNFEKALKNLHSPFDLIFVDGNHSKEATLSYFNALLKLVHNDTVIIFDDIYLSREMTEAWEEIKSHQKVTVTIDTFKWGFVFFREEQAKQHFVVRF